MEDELAAVDPADRQLPMELEQDTMSVLPLNMLDGEIVTLRASFTTNRKAIDEAKDEILEQVDAIKQAKARDANKSVILKYTKLLDSLLDDGDKKLNFFTEQVDALLLKLEMLILKLENSDAHEHARVVLVRNKLVGDAKPYKRIFIKLRVKYVICSG